MTKIERAIRHTLIAVDCERSWQRGAAFAFMRTAELHRLASARLMAETAAETEARRDRLKRAFRGDISGYSKSK